MGGTKGIEEISIYQMFSSPSPLRIIYELRFGLFSNLCIAHLDRFGRRTFYYQFDDDGDEDKYHFNADLTNLDIFNEVDVIGLADFIRDDGKRKSFLITNDDENMPLIPDDDDDDTKKEHIKQSSSSSSINISSSQTQTIKMDKNVANINVAPKIITNDNTEKSKKPSPIKTTKTSQKKKKKKSQKNNARKRASTTTATSSSKRKNKIINKKTTTITTTHIIKTGEYRNRSSSTSSISSVDEEMKIRKIKKLYQSQTPTVVRKNKLNKNGFLKSDIVVDKQNGVTFQNYTFTAFFQRRLSAQNGINRANKRNLNNIRYTVMNEENVRKNSKNIAIKRRNEEESPSKRKKMVNGVQYS